MILGTSTPADAWHALLRADVEQQPAYWDDVAGRMRAARLTFGDRVHCPFLRPLFLEPADVERVTRVAETIATVGERVVHAALGTPALLDAVGLTDEERALVRLDPGYERASTASRLDGFLLPDRLMFAEYNAESPAGLGYAEVLARLFDDLEVMSRFKATYAAEYFPLMSAILEALVASYREWGGTASPPTVLIVDFRGVPTWAEFEILAAHFESRGVPVVVADPRELTFEHGALYAHGRRIDLVYRRVLINDILARPGDCAALLEAYRSRAACVANSFRCKIPHKKAFFAILTDDAWAGLFTGDERAAFGAHIPWTRVVADRATTVGGRRVGLLEHVRAAREDLVIKPNDEYGGAGVVLGWEVDDTAWVAAIDRALAGPAGQWVVQRRIPVRREVFPYVDIPHRVVMRDFLVDLAPYIFCGRVAGFLTRLSSTGLANVTSGGGQVPSFVVSPRQG